MGSPRKGERWRTRKREDLSGTPVPRRRHWVRPLPPRSCGVQGERRESILGPRPDPVRRSRGRRRSDRTGHRDIPETLEVTRVLNPEGTGKCWSAVVCPESGGRRRTSHTGPRGGQDSRPRRDGRRSRVDTPGVPPTKSVLWTSPGFRVVVVSDNPCLGSHHACPAPGERDPTSEVPAHRYPTSSRVVPTRVSKLSHGHVRTCPLTGARTRRGDLCLASRRVTERPLTVCDRPPGPTLRLQASFEYLRKPRTSFSLFVLGSGGGV